jgi:hypothetical protein
VRKEFTTYIKGVFSKKEANNFWSPRAAW